MTAQVKNKASSQTTSMRDLVNHFVGKAARASAQSSKAVQPVLVGAAQTFRRLAADPANARLQRELIATAAEFARAAVSRARQPTIEDFTDLLDETELAIQEVGESDPMDITARRREIHTERNGDAGGRGGTSTPDSFSNEDATLGRTAVIQYNPSQDDVALGVAQSQTVAFWQGTKREAQALTIDTSIAMVPQAGASARPYAMIEFGSDGNKTNVKIDAGPTGRRVTVLGNYASVLVGMDPPRTGLLAARATMGASIGAYGAPSVAPVTCTEYIDDLANDTTSALIRIPQKAVALLSPQVNRFAGFQRYLVYTLDGVSLLQVVMVLNGGTNPPAPVIPLANDAAYVAVYNLTGGLADFRLPFQLSM